MFGQPTQQEWQFDTVGQTECMNRLLYMVESGESFTLLTGPFGTGKSTVLRQVARQLNRDGWTTVGQNVASLDGRAALWHLSGALSIASSPDAGSSELMVQLRDELAARSSCGHRTAILLDDADLAQADIHGVLQLLTSIADSNHGLVSLIVAVEQRLAPSMQQRTSLSIALEPLDVEESLGFAHAYMTRLDCQADRILDTGWRAMTDLSRGLPGQIARIGQIVHAVMSIEPGPIDAAMVVESTRELLPQAA